MHPGYVPRTYFLLLGPTSFHYKCHHKEWGQNPQETVTAPNPSAGNAVPQVYEPVRDILYSNCNE